MNFNLCPSCLAENADAARRCHACGHVLLDEDTTVPTPLDAPATQLLPGGLWLDDLSPSPPPRPAQRVQAPFTITLRNVATPPLAQPVPPAPPRPALPKAEEKARLLEDLPRLDDALDFQPLPPAPALASPTVAPPLQEFFPDLPTLTDEQDLPPLPPPLPPLAARAPVLPPPLPPPLQRKPLPAKPPPAPLVVEDDEPVDPVVQAQIEAKRAARRASVRRSRQRALAAVNTADDIPEVLVLDRDDVERGILCGLLQAFGFGTHSVGSAEKATELLADHRFVAVFADIAVNAADGGAGIEFARQVRAMPNPPLFVLVTGVLSPIDRVRAELAGFSEFLTKRVTRGSVARTLDVHGIPLPADARKR